MERSETFLTPITADISHIRFSSVSPEYTIMDLKCEIDDLKIRVAVQEQVIEDLEIEISRMKISKQ